MGKLHPVVDKAAVGKAAVGKPLPVEDRAVVGKLHPVVDKAAAVGRGMPLGVDPPW